MNCRYCRRELTTRMVTNQWDDVGYHKIEWLEWIHASGDPVMCIDYEHTARPEEGLSMEDIMRDHPHSEVRVHTVLDDFMPYEAHVSEAHTVGSQLIVMTHIYTGWEADRLSLERTDISY